MLIRRKAEKVQKRFRTQMETDGQNVNVAADAPVELLSQNQAAAFLHKSPRVLRFWRTAGIGPAYVKLGKTVLYNRSDLIAYVWRNTVQPSVQAAIEEGHNGAL